MVGKFSEELSETDGKTYFVMDLSQYSEDDVKEISPLAKWISRVAETSVFLKKPSRIVSLGGVVMVLSLLVYSVAQFKMRKALEEHDETIPDQKKLKSLNQSVVTDLKVSPDFIRDSLMAVPTFSRTKKF